MVFVRNSLIASAMALMFSASEAHVTLNPKFVESKQNLTTAFHVPHGCGNFSTTAIMATVPQGPTSVVPQQVANWTLNVEYTDETNTTISTITWSGGNLGAHDALDFPFNVSIPEVDLSSKPNVTYYFPVVQTCQTGQNNWTAIPGVNANGETSPSLVVVKNATQAAADALAIKNNSTAAASASASASAAGASKSPSAGNSLYAGLVPVAAAVAAAAIAAL